MYSQFGQKWAKFHHGPLWSVAHSMQLTNRKKSDINWERDDESMVLQGLHALIAIFTFFVMV